MLVAFLCVLTTALFALADASASEVAPPGAMRSPVEIIVAAEERDDGPVVSSAGRGLADSDNPFEHGRLSLGQADGPAPRLTACKPLVVAATGPAGAASPLPERPPRL